jgi:hypothetical protein
MSLVREGMSWERRAAATRGWTGKPSRSRPDGEGRNASRDFNDSRCSERRFHPRNKRIHPLSVQTPVETRRQTLTRYAESRRVWYLTLADSGGKDDCQAVRSPAQEIQTRCCRGVDVARKIGHYLPCLLDSRCHIRAIGQDSFTTLREPPDHTHATPTVRS